MRPDSQGRKANSLKAVLAAFACIVLAAIMEVNFMTTHSVAGKQSNSSTMLGALLHDKRLEQYYHFDVLPERLPLRIVNLTKGEIDVLGINIGGKPVELASSKEADAIGLTRLQVNGDKGSIAFSYKPEGIEGVAELRRKGSAWRIESLNITEH